MARLILTLLWSVCVVVAVVATCQAIAGDPESWFAAVFWWAVSIGTFVWYHGGWQNIKCLFGDHQWSMTRGFYGEPHDTAVCKNCGDKPKEYN